MTNENRPAPGMEIRRRWVREGDPRDDADFVLYWMQVQRRIDQNLALEETIRIANDLRLPVLVYEGLRPDYPQANARIHTFVVDGMKGNRADARRRGLGYLPYIAEKGRVDREAIAQLARRAALVVTDESPAFIFEGQTRALARRIDCPLLAIDGCGVVPLREMEKREYSAATIRPKIHSRLETYLKPLVASEVATDAGALDLDLPFATDLDRPVAEIARASGVDRGVPPSPLYEGGRRVALVRLEAFLRDGLDGYAERRRNAGVEGTSRLSPYLHFGFVGAVEVALAVSDARAPDDDKEAFLEELIVRRELCFNFAYFEPEHTRVASLPEWARKTLAKHLDDERPPVTRDEIVAAETYDEIWNLAQRELLATGEIHNAARMLWGKKILEWSRTPQDAVDLMILLHHRYALDGRSPLTYTNILWCLGLHDRAWGPERPIYGTVRYMSSDAFRRKHDVAAYRERIEEAEALAAAAR